MDNVQWPDEEDAGLGGGVRVDGHVLHVLVHLTLHRDPPPQDLGRYLGAQDEVVIPEVANTDDQGKSSVPHCDDRLVTEDDGLTPVPGS